MTDNIEKYPRFVKFGEMLTRTIKDRGERQTKRLIYDKLEISSSTLSQYISGKVHPSFQRLVKLAVVLDVNLDYLVFGDSSASPKQVDYGPYVKSTEQLLHDFRVQSKKHRWIYGRIAQALANHIDDVAQELATDGSQRLGLSRDEETMRLESYSCETIIISMNLEHDIRHPGTEKEGPGRYLTTVGDNLLKDRSYSYLVPAGLKDWETIKGQYLHLLQDYVGSEQLVLENCEFRYTTQPILTGCILYRLDIDELQRNQPIFHEQFDEYINDDGWIGLIVAPSMQPESDAVMDIYHLTNALKTAAILWDKGITF